MGMQHTHVGGGAAVRGIQVAALHHRRHRRPQRRFSTTTRVIHIYTCRKGRQGEQRGYLNSSNTMLSEAKGYILYEVIRKVMRQK
ncbi:hypothetical protein E2C01_060371 [Portunus trituberculatus]|uniref:Uncharacterized protein n=1 Tax=Portunus trituberculatus TaxID=210409 RepID=A0A5B7H7V0_PORTR|nr:hypothetical protein [Portunus trituberculatus]